MPTSFANASTSSTQTFLGEPRALELAQAQLRLVGAALQAPRSQPQPPHGEQTLPFSIHQVNNEQELREVQALRQAAYGHHLPHIAESFGLPDPADLERSTTIFIARDKATGSTVGIARVRINRHAPLQIESSMQLPDSLVGKRLAEITRLAVLPGYGQPVRLALVKASYLFCVAMQVSGVLAGSRKSLVRQYEALGFVDLFGDKRMVPLAHAGGLEHRILFLNPIMAEGDWRGANRPTYGFLFETAHPDIAIFDSMPSQRGTALAA